MKLFLSPALNVTPTASELPLTVPRYLSRANALAAMLAQRDPFELESLLSLSPMRAIRAKIEYDRFGKDTGAAILSFRGLVYSALDAAHFSRDDLLFANENLCIASALYGTLRPLDAISPYRLELNSDFRPYGAPLADHWGDAFAALSNRPVLNLASEEYSAPLKKHLSPQTPVMNVECLALYKGRYRNIVAWTKQMRGALARYAILSRASSPWSIVDFEGYGFRFSESRSSADRLVFLKD